MFNLSIYGCCIWYFLKLSKIMASGPNTSWEIDVSLELSCFFDDPADVGNLTSGSSAFSKTSLNIRKFMDLRYADDATLVA